MEHEAVTMKRIIIDTDPGIDDTAALFLALASPELHVEALTTVYGNGTIADCTRNALVVLETAGRSDIPVYQGWANHSWGRRPTAQVHAAMPGGCRGATAR
jgi:inosine-uridine nucleoside N-ribohydrolase